MPSMYFSFFGRIRNLSAQFLIKLHVSAGCKQVRNILPLVYLALPTIKNRKSYFWNARFWDVNITERITERMTELKTLMQTLYRLQLWGCNNSNYGSVAPQNPPCANFQYKDQISGQYRKNSAFFGRFIWAIGRLQIRSSENSFVRKQNR